jgi:hypothetical protein
MSSFFDDMTEGAIAILANAEMRALHFAFEEG